MSWIALKSVWEDSPSSGGRLLVLVALADLANQDGECWPSVEALAEMTRLTARQVQRVLNELAADGEIEMPRGARNESNPFVVGHPRQVTPTSGPTGHLEQLDLTSTRGRVDPPGRPTNDPPTALARIWDHYQRTIPGALRQKLDSTRTTIIRNALKVRDEAACCRAIDGLARSPFHNGENDRRKKYLGIRYALKGNTATGESNDERIDKMAEMAAPTAAGLLAGVPSEIHATIRGRQRLVEENLLNPGDRNLAARAGVSQQWLLETWGLVAVVEGSEVSWRRGAPPAALGDEG